MLKIPKKFLKKHCENALQKEVKWFIVSVSKAKGFHVDIRSSFSPLSYIIQEAVNQVYCFLNFYGDIWY